jgi:hypothetical protein
MRRLRSYGASKRRRSSCPGAPPGGVGPGGGGRGLR